MLQNLYDLADMKVMYEILDSRAFTEFCCINSPDEVPDGDTIGRFRNLLNKYGLQHTLLKRAIHGTSDTKCTSVLTVIPDWFIMSKRHQLMSMMLQPQVI